MAALAAVTGPQEIVREMRDAYRERRDAAVALLQSAEVPVLRPSGAFYLWVDITRSGRDSRDFAFSLIADRGVAVAPGTGFGAAGEASSGSQWLPNSSSCSRAPGGSSHTSDHESRAERSVRTLQDDLGHASTGWRPPFADRLRSEMPAGCPLG
jgi:aminotransferase class I and II